MLYKLLRTLLFMLDAERAHTLTLKLLRLMQRVGLTRLIFPKPIQAPFDVMGLTFNNRVGLAAGMDKNADYIDALAITGFGFIEVGTVTPRPQPGNAKPRLFRLPEAEAIINRMGFNNKGVEHLINAVKSIDYDGVLGINIGKNADTAVEKATDDYLTCFTAVYPHADYITINISSPNTPGLRSLQHGDALTELLSALKTEQHDLHQSSGRYVPLVVKIAPDLSDDEILALAKTFVELQVDGVIATNTTFSRVGVEGMQNADEQGGLSGKPVMQQSTHVVRLLAENLQGQIPIIAAGGISSADDAVEKIRAGAKLVQIYTGFIYQGPALVKTCSQALSQLSD